MTRRFFTMAIALILLTMILAGCGTSSTPPGTAAQSRTGTPAQSEASSSSGLPTSAATAETTAEKQPEASAKLQPESTTKLQAETTAEKQPEASAKLQAEATTELQAEKSTEETTDEKAEVPEQIQSAPITTQKAATQTAENASEKEINPMLEITMKNGGIIQLELDRAAAPITVDNFVKLVEEEFYDGLTFHRAVAGFMIQGGSPTGDGIGGSDQTIKGEFASNGWNNPIKHTRGVISMARSRLPDSASSQFFIMHEDAPFLDGEYAAFGRVVDGMDIVDRMAEAKVTGETPVEPEVIETIRLVMDSSVLF